MTVQNAKSKSFEDIFEFYKPLIEAKNSDENQDIANRNVFDDTKFHVEEKRMMRDGNVKTNKFILPFEQRLLDLRK